MATSTLNPVLDHLRRAVLLRDGAGLTDAQLLEAVVSRKDEAAFAALVRRHGPMVLGVCRRVLHNHHDCEDAFQATFLVLFRKAGSIAPRGMVANWLYGVAYRTALKARSIITRHSVRERQVTDMPEPEAAQPDDCWRDVQPLLDQEMSHLPDKYRVPIVLCDLQGRTGKEAARQLGWPEGTVASRLSRGRGMLAKRLTRRGLVLSAGSLAAMLSQSAVSACVPASLASSTIKAASFLAAGQALTTSLITAKVAALMEGVLKAMLLTKLKTSIVLFFAVGFLSAVFAFRLTHGTEAAGPATVAKGAEPKNDKNRLQGIWQQISCQGKDAVPIENVKKTTLVINDDTITVQTGGKFSYALTFTLDESKNPKTVNELLIKPEKRDEPYLGIYALDGDTVKFCFSDPGKKRPIRFVGGVESGWTLTVFKRIQPGKKEADEKPDVEKPPNQEQAKQILNMILKGLQAYQDSKGGGKQKEKTDKGNSILSSDDLQGKWRGEKNGIKVELTFRGEQAHWQVEFRKTRKPRPPLPPTTLVNKGAALKAVADAKAGCLNLYLPKYLGDKKEFKENPSFNGLRPVGQLQRGGEGTIQLRIIPTGSENLDQEYFDWPAVEGLILRRVTEPPRTEGK